MPESDDLILMPVTHADVCVEAMRYPPTPHPDDEDDEDGDSDVDTALYCPVESGQDSLGGAHC